MTRDRHVLRDGIEELAVPLTNAELQERGDRLAHAQGELESHALHEQDVKATLKAQRTAVEAKIANLASIVRNKREVRSVAVQVVADYGRRCAATVRQDTGEIVSERPLTELEMQASLDGVA